MDKLKMHTPNLADENFKKLAAIFPNAVTETITGYDEEGKAIIERAIDADVLRQEISAQVVEGTQERYQFTWPDKKKSVVLANAPIAKTLRLDREKSVGRDGTSGSIDSENIYIEGDNLDALKLLQETYLGKVKMIYIDPPYNTGNDVFVYDDNFTENSEEFSNISGQRDEYGNLLFDMKLNNEANGRFHTDWLNMVYPRIKLARDLLADDGVIFISLDDNESTNMTKICDEIFGRQNRISLICHKARASVSNDKIISPNHNTIMFYAKNFQNIHEKRKFIGLAPDLSGFNVDDDDGRGPYRLVPVDGPGGAKKGNPYYEFLGIEGYFRFSKEIMQKKYDQGLVVKKENSLYQKYFLSAARETRRTVTTWWDDAGLTSNATSYIKNLMGGSFFDNPKPLELIERMLQMITFDDNEAIIMDFFSGSATTAEAVMKMNATDNGKRVFILIQIQEKISQESDAYEAGYHIIPQIGEERIRRAGKKIKEETNADIDYGFRVFKVDSTNMKEVYYKPSDYKQMNIAQYADNIKEDRTSEDLLFQAMLDLGILLSSKIEETEIAGKKIFSVADNYLIACFDSNITEQTVTEIAKQHPSYAVFRDSGMATDSVATNFEQIFETYSPKTQRKVL